MKIIGHRGARGLAPENTLLALLKGLHYNVDELEFDVRVTQDGIPILHHDKTLKDRKGTKLNIRQKSCAELKKHKPDLASLAELLKALDGQKPLYLEVKPGEDVEPIVKALRDYKGDFLLGSKSQKTLVELHKSLPDVPMIVIHPWSGVIASRRAKQVGATRISMNQLWLWSGFIKRMSRSYQLSAYTLNDPVKARRWQKAGLYGVVTDYPDIYS